MRGAGFLAAVCVLSTIGEPASAFNGAFKPVSLRTCTGRVCPQVKSSARQQGLRGAVAKREDSMVHMLAALKAKNLEKEGAAAAKAFKGPDKIYKAVKKASGASTMLIEYARNDQVPPHRIDPYSFEARRSKAAVIVINAGIEFGDEDVAKFVKEQNSAKGNFPGPVPIVYRGVDVTKDTVLKAKELGVDGLALRGDQFDEAALTEIISELYKVNIEPFMEISDVSQIPIAVNAGARTMCVRFETDMMPKFLTKATLQMRDDIPKDCVAVGTVKARQGGAEIEQIRSLSDAGFHGVLLSQMVSDANEETALPYMKYIIAVYGSKKSQSLKINEAKGLQPFGYSPAAGFGDSGTHV